MTRQTWRSNYPAPDPSTLIHIDPNPFHVHLPRGAVDLYTTEAADFYFAHLGRDFDILLGLDYYLVFFGDDPDGILLRLVYEDDALGGVRAVVYCNFVAEAALHYAPYRFASADQSAEGLRQPIVAVPHGPQHVGVVGVAVLEGYHYLVVHLRQESDAPHRPRHRACQAAPMALGVQGRYLHLHATQVLRVRVIRDKARHHPARCGLLAPAPTRR